MATLEEIHDFESAVEMAVREALAADKGITARIPQEQGIVPHQFVGARLTVGTPMNHHHMLEADRWAESAFNATLTFYVRTVRECEDALFPSSLHASLRSGLRVFMLDGIALINAKLTLHELSLSATPQGASVEYSDNRYDITELPYTIYLSIKPDAWPA